MAFKTLFSGPAAEIGDVVKVCDLQWTIQIKDGNLEDADVIPFADVDVKIDDAAARQVTADENGYITLVFTKGTKLASVKVVVEHREYHWTGRAGAPQEEEGANQYSSEALLTGVWSLRVLVYDERPKGVDGDPIPLEKVPVSLTWRGGSEDGTTANDGDAWTKDDVKCETACHVSVPASLGAIASLTHVWVTINDNAGVEADETKHEEDDVTVRCSDKKVLTIEAMPANARVEVRFRLQFRTVFIVGEGPDFPYAIQLAIRFGKGQSPRNLTQTVSTAPATKLSERRMWIVASQYDLKDPPGGLPTNLVPYRDKVRKDDKGKLGRFDVRDKNCWTRLAGDDGRFDLFDVMVFNNPHPGFGVHFCEVKGLRSKICENRHISVHSIGWDKKLPGKDLTTFRGLKDCETAAVQKKFLNDRSCDQKGGDALHNWRDDGSLPEVTIPDAFTPITQADVDFDKRVTHYTTAAATMGLWFSILRCYCRNGKAALLSGGEMYVNGSAVFQSAITKGHLENFENGVKWSTGEYYANYQTNLTSNQYHPSWFGDPDWSPGEPNLANANYYRWVKG